MGRRKLYTISLLIMQIVAVSSSTLKRQLTNDDDYQALEVLDKSPVGILRLRGFKSEVHYAITKDGYFLNLVRIVNPLHREGVARKRPVLFNHGLFESSTIWLINSRDVKPLDKSSEFCRSLPIESNGTEFTSLALMLAINGYDVWLLSMRGTDFSQFHEIHDRSTTKFWDYSLDQFALGDVPAAIDYVRAATGCKKLGYVGHSQATFSVFGLLATEPRYTDLLEPVVAIAPVAFMNSTSKPLQLFFESTLVTPEIWIPAPDSAKLVRASLGKACFKSKQNRARPLCEFIRIIIGGEGEHWLAGYFSHLPFYSSSKVLRHFGQMIKSGRFSMFDYGPDENTRRYGQSVAPDYEVARIRSKSLVLVWSKADTLSSPVDVERFIRELRVAPLKAMFIKEKLNHFDLITGNQTATLVNAPLLEVFEAFEQVNGRCSSKAADSN